MLVGIITYKFLLFKCVCWVDWDATTLSVYISKVVDDELVISIFVIENEMYFQKKSSYLVLVKWVKGRRSCKWKVITSINPS